MTTWTARWIAPVEGDDLPARQRPAYQLAGAAAPRRARWPPRVLHATAHGIYEAFVNGTRVGDQELTPGWTAYRSRLQVQTFDVTDLLVAGDNVIGALLSDGWWRGQNSVARRVDDYGTTTALLAQLDVTLRRRHDDQRSAPTASWRSTPSHILARRPHRRRGPRPPPARRLGRLVVLEARCGSRTTASIGSSTRPRRRSAGSRSCDRCRSAELGTRPLGRRRRPEHQRLDPPRPPRAAGHRGHPHLRRVARPRRRRHPGAPLRPRRSRPTRTCRSRPTW